MDVLELLKLEVASKKLGEPLKEQYARVSIDLSEARTDEAIHLSGDSIAVASFDGAATTTYFKLNHKHSRELYPAEVEKLYAKFGGIYMTNVAEAGKTLVLYIGRAIFIYPSAAKKVRILDPDGTNIAVARDSRFKSHTFKHKEQTTQNAAGTAEALMVASTKVRWAIIHFETLARVGDASITIDAGAHPGQQYPANTYMTVEVCDLNEIYIMDAAGVAVIYTINYVEEA